VFGIRFRAKSGDSGQILKGWAPGANNRATQKESSISQLIPQYTQPHLAQCGVEGRDSLISDGTLGRRGREEERTRRTIDRNKIKITKIYLMKINLG